MSEHGGRRRLPERQPWRAAVVLALYLLTLAAASVPVLLLLDTPLGWALMFALACLLTVPVAIAAPRRKELAAATNGQPVLVRRAEPSSPTTDYDS